MSELKDIEYVSVEEIKPQGQLVSAVLFKPTFAPIVILLCGIGLLIPNNLLSRILGLFFLLMAATVIFLIKDYKVMDIFEEGIEVYGDPEAKTAAFIRFENIRQWGVTHENGRDLITLQLADGSVIARSTFQAGKPYKALVARIPQKEDRYVQMLENRQKIPSIPEVINNIKDKLTKK